MMASDHDEMGVARAWLGRVSVAVHVPLLFNSGDVANLAYCQACRHQPKYSLERSDVCQACEFVIVINRSDCIEQQSEEKLEMSFRNPSERLSPSRSRLPSIEILAWVPKTRLQQK